MSVDVRPGVKYGYLTVVEYLPGLRSAPNVRVRCECGVVKLVRKNALRSGTKSCGCKWKEMLRSARVRHGQSGTRNQKKTKAYEVWCSMRRRCNEPSHKSYADYGGRGISVAPEWNEFSVFLADMGPPPRGMQLERVDNSRGYSKANCVWATPKQNNNNRRSNRLIECSGKRMTLTEWAAVVGVFPDTLSKRLEAGWPIEKALQPTRRITSASRTGRFSGQTSWRTAPRIRGINEGA